MKIFLTVFALDYFFFYSDEHYTWRRPENVPGEMKRINKKKQAVCSFQEFWSD